MQTLTIATRKSPLALWQAKFVQAELKKAHQHRPLNIELLAMTTQGDKILDVPLAKIGGKGLFIKELERGILEGRADLAAHSMKDVPAEEDFPEGLGLSTICLRENPFDAFVSNHYKSIDDLPQGATIGTCSLRRRCQLLHYRPDLDILDLRGNVNSRLTKLDQGDFDAIILACAGLIRLEMSDRIQQQMSPDIILPAVGQGAVGLEIRTKDLKTKNLLQVLNDENSWVCVNAERAMSQKLGGGCQVPIAGFAELNGDALFLRGLVGQPDGTRIITAEKRGHRDEAKELGIALAEDLLAQGAGRILQSL